MSNLHPYRAEPTRVIHTKGTDYEMGRQHAEALGEIVRQGMPKFYHDFWQRMAEGTPSGIGATISRKLVVHAMDKFLLRRLVKNLPRSITDRIEGLADGSKQSINELVISAVLPDLMPILEVLLYKVSPKTFIEVTPPPRFGCSSFIASGKEFLHGRNLDFPGVAYWDRYPVIQLFQPLQGMRYIGFGTAGVPFAGITGINEAQISVALHQHYCGVASFRGEPPFAIGEEILRRAKTLDEAEEIIRQGRVASSWAFILTDGKKREGRIVECNPKAVAARALEKPGLTHSNYYQTASCRVAEFATTARMNWDNYYRKERLKERLEAVGGSPSVEEAIGMISEHYDPFWQEEKILNRTVSQVYNIQSLVFDTERMKVWMAEGDAPIQIRQFREYDLGSIFAGHSGKTEVVFPAFRFKTPHRARAKEQYIFSFIAAFDGDFRTARQCLDRVLEEEMVPEVAQVAGVVDWKLDRFQEAAEMFARGKEDLEKKLREKKLSQPPPEYFEISLYLARTYDLLGKPELAQKGYREIANDNRCQDAHLRRIAKNHKPYSKKRVSQILMPYSSYIPFH